METTVMKRRYAISRRLGLAALILLLNVLPFAGRSAAQEQAGVIGQVTDNSGGVLPGVTVTTTSPVLQVRSMTAVTNERGEYRIAPLPIGTYTVEYTLAGFQTVRRENVRLTVGFVARLDIQLNVGSLNESITVSGAAPVVDVSSTTVSTRLTNEALLLLPGARNGLQAIMGQAPGVRTNINVGAAGFTAVPLFKAFGQDGNGWTQLDGVAMMTAKRRSAGGTPRWDYQTIEEAQVQSLAGDADVPRQGVTVSGVIKSGGNDFHGTGSYNGTSDKFEGDNRDAALVAQGITSTGGIQRRWDIFGELSGRVIRDKLWFYVEQRHQDQITRTVQCFEPSGKPCTGRLAHPTFTEKISYQMNGSTRITHFFHSQHIYTWSGGSRLVPYSARSYNDQFSKAAKGEVQVVRGNSLVLSALLGYFGWDNLNENFGTEPYRIDLVTREVYPGSASSGGGGGQPDWGWGPRVNLSWYKPDWFYGNHAFKAGFDYLQYRADSSYRMPAGAKKNPWYRLQFRNGTPDSIVIPNFPVDPISRVAYLPVYLQDSWTIARRLTLGLGLRFEHSVGWAPEQCREAAPPPGDVAFPAACYDRIDIKPWNSFVPRVRAAYDVTGDGKTVIKGGWGRYARNRNAEDPQAFEQNGPAFATYRWRDVNGNRDYDRGEVDLRPNGPDFLQIVAEGRSLSGSLAKVLVNPNEKQPVSDEFSISLERELMAGFAMRATAVYHRNLNGYRIYNELRPYSAFTIPITNRDPGPDGVVGNADDTGKFITYYDFPASYAGAQFLSRMQVNDPESDQHYKSLELAASKRLADRWQFQASYSTTQKHIPWAMSIVDNISNTVEFTEIDPNAEINTGDFTREWLARVSGSYSFPMDILAAVKYEHRSGTPLARTALFRGGVQIPSITLNVEPLGSLYLPNIALTDFSLQKSFAVRNRQRVGLRLNVYNVFNTNVVTAMTVQSGPNFGRATSILLPRIFEMGVAYSF
jgi:hypothetical protein